ncbi:MULTISPECIES: DNA polymerase III subunit gamma/tau [unclassified Paenibacillus]|uniref:DNA polymerase III subunit gamma/tau n=1 Tax=Paenibacillus TaxID=44249 RepID=UPI000436BD5E|nr:MULTISPECIES: DNA polymerase III subunit gamma/tau [unclassified Paenibacillus]KKC48533.1 DNA polymerase III subunit gamma/tau [Paenibacillus sp. D9]CDN46076.1 DNA polymerase III subunit gamma/tau [Paenibacillus sp. P22]
MTHIALYRAWRPQTFRDMVGQQHIRQTLQNAIREQRIAHAYLFNGPRGTGKTSAAKIFAKAVNCELGPAPEPCNECAACRGITAGTVMDVVEIDAASNRGIDEIREIRDNVRYAPSEVRYKVYIIDEVHMLTTEAFNALLKTLEEPPSHVIFILATTEPHKLPPTIISRCQRFDFRQVSLEEQVERLTEICKEEGIRAEPEAIDYIARLSDGGMRDAISLLEQAAAFGSETITLEGAVDVTGGLAAQQFAGIADAVRDRDAGAILPLVEGLMQAGKSPDKCLENLMYYFRDLLVLKLAPGSAEAMGRVSDPARFQAMAEGFSADRIFRMIDELNRYHNEMRHAAHPQTLFEVALLKIATMPEGGSQSSGASATAGAAAPQASPETGRLLQRIDDLERKIEQLQRSGSAPAAAPEASASGSAVRGGASRGGGFGPRSGSGSVRNVKLDPYLAALSNSETAQLRAKWSEVLARVKDARVTVHAWLVDGEPVASTGDSVLVAFKNTIHRETTEKQANRELIEKVLQEAFGRALSLSTVMQKDWQQASSGAVSERASAPLELSHDDPPQAPARPEWVEEAVRLFGEDLVELKKD